MQSQPANQAQTALIRHPYSVAVLSTGGRLHRKYPLNSVLQISK